MCFVDEQTESLEIRQEIQNDPFPGESIRVVFDEQRRERQFNQLR